MVRYLVSLFHRKNKADTLTVTEPFISPALYEPYVNGSIAVVDEWTLSQAMGSDLPTLMEQHYETFIVRYLPPFDQSPYVFIDRTRFCRSRRSQIINRSYSEANQDK